MHDAHVREIFCSRNITDTHQVSLITVFRTDEDLDVMTSEWIDVEEVVHAARSGTTQPSKGRNILKYPGPIASTSRTSKVWGIGSTGFHESWIDYSGDEGSRVLNVVPLHSVGNDDSTNLSSRPLHLPIAVDYVSEILAFCDEAAVIAVFTEACESGCCRPSVRFFDY